VKLWREELLLGLVDLSLDPVQLIVHIHQLDDGDAS
jgi:hypothetical protein